MIRMYYDWLDRWDEQRARRGDAQKEKTALVLDAELAFPDAPGVTSIADFCALADRATADSTYFSDLSQEEPIVDWGDGWIRFQSSVLTGVEENDLVWAKVIERRSSKRALVVCATKLSIPQDRQLLLAARDHCGRNGDALSP
jgi:hypothetical protein